MGVSPSLVTDWLAGRRLPNMNQGFIIQDLLKTPPQSKADRPTKPDFRKHFAKYPVLSEGNQALESLLREREESP